MRLTGDQKSSKKIQKNRTLKSFCYFLSLKYGADLGRSRLVKVIFDLSLYDTNRYQFYLKQRIITFHQRISNDFDLVFVLL